MNINYLQNMYINANIYLFPMYMYMQKDLKFIKNDDDFIVQVEGIKISRRN